MTIAKRNYEIVEHLRQRFKERYDIELTKNKRMMLLNQIRKKIGSQTCMIRKDIELWKVELYNQKTYCNQPFIVLYDRAIDQIKTVLPPTDSEEFKEFCERVHISKEQLLNQQLTARESTTKSVNRVAEMRMKQAVVREGLLRLDGYKSTMEYFYKNKA